MKKIFIIILLIISTISLVGCSNDKAYDLYLSAVEDGYSGSFEDWLGSRGDKELEIDIVDGYIAYRYKGDSSWTKVKCIDELSGSNGKSAYNIYKENYPEYKGSEKEWIDDLINGRLINKGLVLESRNIDILAQYLATSRPLIKTYFTLGGNVPYLGFNEVFCVFNTAIPHKMNLSKNDNSFIYTYSFNNKEYKMSINYDRDEIELNSVDFLSLLFGDSNDELNKRMEEVSKEISNDNSVLFKLKDYDIDIIKYNDDLLIPADIMGMIIFNYSLNTLIYKPNQFYICRGLPSGIENLRLNRLNGNNTPKDLKEATLRGLFFTLDYFYGLREEVYMDKLSDMIKADKGLMEMLLNCNPKHYNEGYTRVFGEYMDENHSLPFSKSIYNDMDESLFKDNEFKGFKRKEYMKSLEYYKELYKNNLGDNDPYKKPLRYIGSTAFIKIDSFLSGRLWDEENEDGTIKDTAWINNDFFKVKQSLDDIREYNIVNGNVIKNVCIDLTQNGGGYISVMQEAVGLFTNKDIPHATIDMLSGKRMLRMLRFDSDLDGDFTDDDAYTEFNYTFLVSDCSFSAANHFAALVKDLKIGKLIGITTGGGMCTLGSFAMLDGTVSSFSTNYSHRQYANGEFLDTEGGIDVDYEINPEKFYDLKYINSFINNGYKEV